MRCVSRLFVACVLCATLGACAEDGWRRLLYDMGDGYACQHQELDQTTAAGRAAQCADASHPARTRYDDYKDARERQLGRTP